MEKSMKVAVKFDSPLSLKEARAQARLLKALASPVRLRILSLLIKHGGQICVDEIAECLPPLGQPTISHHLKTLSDAHVVDCRKNGLWAYYYVRGECLTQAQGIIAALGGKA